MKKSYSNRTNVRLAYANSPRRPRRSRSRRVHTDQLRFRSTCEVGRRPCAATRSGVAKSIAANTAYAPCRFVDVRGLYRSDGHFLVFDLETLTCTRCCKISVAVYGRAFLVDSRIRAVTEIPGGEG